MVVLGGGAVPYGRRTSARRLAAAPASLGLGGGRGRGAAGAQHAPPWHALHSGRHIYTYVCQDTNIYIYIYIYR